ncbi:MAG: hypothetical protein ACE5KE_16125, partial [Methanosarcinales archaeon]
MIVVSNAGPLIALGKLNVLPLLEKLYQKVFIPREVYKEVIIRGLEKGHIDAFRAKQLIGKSLIVKDIV